MISHLEGKIIHTGERFVVLQANGVGYKVFTTSETLQTLKNKLNESAGLWTYLAVRENALDLYGFAGKEELDFCGFVENVGKRRTAVGSKTDDSAGSMNVFALRFKTLGNRLFFLAFW